MIPGFVTAYRDDDNYVHLYFFPGIDDDDKPIYRNIDLSHITIKYDINKQTDEGIDYKFYDKNIIRLHCKLLINLTEEEIYETLEI